MNNTNKNLNLISKEYLNNDYTDEYNDEELISSQKFNFYFQGTKFLWKELVKINTRYIEKSNDISEIEPYVNNILHSRLIVDDIDLLSPEYIVQLVTLLQLTGQYLVYTQKKLEMYNSESKEKIKELEENLTFNEKSQNIIENLNKRNKEKDFLIKTYQNMIKSGYGMSNGFNTKTFNETDNISNKYSKKEKNELIDAEKKYYFCKICSGKKFKSQKYLDEHIKRRHYLELEEEKNSKRENDKNKKNYKEIFEKKLNSMREHFENIIKQSQENTDFYILQKKIDEIQNKIISQNIEPNSIIKNYQQKVSKSQIDNENYGLSKKDEAHYLKIISDKDKELEEVKNLFANYKANVESKLNEQKIRMQRDKERNENGGERITLNRRNKTLMEPNSKNNNNNVITDNTKVNINKMNEKKRNSKIFSIDSSKENNSNNQKIETSKIAELNKKHTTSIINEDNQVYQSGKIKEEKVNNINNIDEKKNDKIKDSKKDEKTNSTKGDIINDDKIKDDKIKDDKIYDDNKLSDKIKDKTVKDPKIKEDNVQEVNIIISNIDIQKREKPQIIKEMNKGIKIGDFDNEINNITSPKFSINEDIKISKINLENTNVNIFYENYKKRDYLYEKGKIYDSILLDKENENSDELIEKLIEKKKKEENFDEDDDKIIEALENYKNKEYDKNQIKSRYQNIMNKKFGLNILINDYLEIIKENQSKNSEIENLKKNLSPKIGQSNNLENENDNNILFHNSLLNS